jgi:hypothetical protein
VAAAARRAAARTTTESRTCNDPHPAPEIRRLTLRISLQVKIIFSFYQIVTQVGEVFLLAYPPAYESVLSVMPAPPHEEGQEEAGSEEDATIARPHPITRVAAPSLSGRSPPSD